MLNIVADQNIPLVKELFKSVGRVTLVDGRALCATQVTDADVLLVRSVTPVNEQLLAGSRVQFVGSATAGYDHLDLAYLAQRNIPVALASGANAESVVEYVLAAICSQPDFLTGLLNGGVLGVVGYGHVGKRLVEVATCLGMNVLAYDPFVDCGAYGTDLDRVLKCDVISLHCELTHNGPFPSQHLLNQARLDHLVGGQLLINASRGGVIDNSALLKRLHQDNPPTVVLDCWESEPKICEALASMVSIATPHVAGYSYDGKARGTMMLRDALGKSLNRSLNSFKFDSDVFLDVDSSGELSTVISDLIASVYRIETDDAELRSALAKANSASDGEWFDRLRRNYPIRRELMGATLVAEQFTDTVQTLGRCFRLELIQRNV